MSTTTDSSVESVVERYSAAWAANDLDDICTLHGDNMVFHLHVEGFPPAVGADAFRGQLGAFLWLWEDMRFDATETHLADGLLVNAYRFSARLVQPLTLLGETLPPRDERVEVDGLDVITVRDGLVRAKHTYLDALAVRSQLLR